MWALALLIGVCAVGLAGWLLFHVATEAIAFLDCRRMDQERFRAEQRQNLLREHIAARKRVYQALSEFATSQHFTDDAKQYVRGLMNEIDGEIDAARAEATR